ncbi:MAG: Permease of the drug/metabolite transporter (DMT) superfamily, partial [uncultured Rubrobacteraceae bacterium]
DHERGTETACLDSCRGRAAVDGLLLRDQLHGGQNRRRERPADPLRRNAFYAGWPPAAPFRALPRIGESPAPRGLPRRAGPRDCRRHAHPDGLHPRGEPDDGGKHGPRLLHGPRVGDAPRIRTRARASEAGWHPRDRTLPPRSRVYRVRRTRVRRHEPSRGHPHIGRRCVLGLLYRPLALTSTTLLSRCPRRLRHGPRRPRCLPTRSPRSWWSRYQFPGRPDVGSGGLLCDLLLGLRLRRLGVWSLPRRGEPRPDLPVPRHPHRREYGHRAPRRGLRTGTTRRGSRHPLRRLPREKKI